jgi:putative transposase
LIHFHAVANRCRLETIESVLKAWRFSDAQRAFTLKQGTDGMPVTDACRNAGTS